MKPEERALYRLMLGFGLFCGAFFMAASEILVGLLWPGAIMVLAFLVLIFLLVARDAWEEMK
jgi:hypothetical protein